MEEEKNKKRRQELDWNLLLQEQDNDPLPILVVKPSTTAEHLESSSMDDFQDSLREEVKRYSDTELESKIQTRKHNIEGSSSRLPDKGKKLEIGLKLMEEEKERRRLTRVAKEAGGCKKLLRSTDSSTGASDGFRQETSSSKADSRSLFASFFCKKVRENTDCRTGKACDKDRSILELCDRQKLKYNGKVSHKEKCNGRSSSRQMPFKSPGDFFLDGNKCHHSYADQKDRASGHSFYHTSENVSSCFAGKKDTYEVQSPDDITPGREHTILLVDEEEPHCKETPEHIDECIKELKIYYPSRNDPESVEIFFADTKCLDPEGYLTSPIMNFYIRFIQQQASSTHSAICDYHFFNTYFYKKLKEALSYKGKDRDSFFMKFRRWWKGVNIFEKAYVLIPIHDELHWSLVIICNPDKKDESGPIILHLDSLGYHSSRSLFDNIKSYMKEEWCYLDKKVDASDLPIAERIWRHLPRRIEEKIITVPQQKNDCDCGLFVLFFMERFIKEAPERLKKKDLAMFNKQWFRPEEASGLRLKIKNLLREEFENDVNCNIGSSPTSSGSSPECTED